MGIEVIFDGQPESPYSRVYAKSDGYFAYVDRLGSEKITWDPRTNQLTISGDLSCENGHPGIIVCKKVLDKPGFAIPEKNIFGKIYDLNRYLAKLKQ